MARSLGLDRGERGGAVVGPEFLRRLRGATSILGSLLLLVILLRLGTLPALSFGAGFVLSIANLFLLEFIAQRVLRPEPMWGPAVYAAVGAKLPLLVGGAALCLSVLHLSPLWFALGFSLFFVTLLLKVIGRMLVSRGVVTPRPIGSTGPSPRSNVLKSVLVLVVAAPLAFGLIGSAWMARDVSARAGLSLSVAPALAQEHAADEHAGDEHGGAASEHAAPAHGEGHAAEGEHHGSEAPEFPNWITLINHVFPHTSWGEFLHHWETPLFSLPVILLLCIVAIIASRNPRLIPGKLQNIVEIAVEQFTNFVEGMLGPQGRRYVPFLGTLFFYIWFSNLQGLLPLMKSPTSVLNTTVALAICVFLYVQYTGFTQLGLKRYFLHLAGDPQDVIGWAMVPLLLPLHIIGEFAKPMSLSLRLFGNVFGEDVLLAVFGTLILIPLGAFKLGLPLHVPFIFLALLLSSIQALVFTLLSTLYFSQMLPHEEHEGGHH